MDNNTICSISTAPGHGAISIIRISGKKSIRIINKLFKAHDKNKLSSKNTKKVILGNIIYKNQSIDEVLVTAFQSPKSYTGEDMVEISCHGSAYIQSKIIQALIDNGCRTAQKGEFTMRAFLNGKLDLSQAEGVANLIASENEQSHKIAMKQMRGGFSDEIKNLRKKFIKFAALIELELDFSQEDVEFANREELLNLIDNIEDKISKLANSFKLGNVIKNGIPITIVGSPNSGKSTLLNQILNEERAIVSNIKGTTRDTIEENIVINGYKFKFIDTAGLRNTQDKIEKIGISKTYKKISESAFILYMIDKTEFNEVETEEEILSIQKKMQYNDSLIVLANKHDLHEQDIFLKTIKNVNIINISAKNGDKIGVILETIMSKVQAWGDVNNQIIIINQRHFESLINTLKSISDIKKGLKQNISGELLSIDIKNCLEYLGQITGEITNDNLLDSIFQDFCIGK
ncbi:MAG: tRNA uridine-5-carboxymethylaminomethyl(34) synthesis GTPase MnmE [Flavobacteriales bacterium]|nr:tRNA uridine-5-carboxymethylaminomethyl(34) synthesis GTPase MnmE [Flavobacteriales bacterium]